MQERMEKMMAQQEENNKVMAEMRNRPVSELTRPANVQTTIPATPAFSCPNCVPVRFPPDMQNPDFRCPGCIPRDPGFGEDIPKGNAVFYDIDSPVKPDPDDSDRPKPSVQPACSGSDSRDETPRAKRKPKPKGRTVLIGNKVTIRVYQEPEPEINNQGPQGNT